MPRLRPYVGFGAGEVNTDAGLFEETDTTVNVAIRLKNDWERILSDVGFSKVQYFGDLDFTPYDKDTSRRLIAVVRN